MLNGHIINVFLNSRPENVSEVAETGKNMILGSNFSASIVVVGHLRRARMLSGEILKQNLILFVWTTRHHVCALCVLSVLPAKWMEWWWKNWPWIESRRSHSHTYIRIHTYILCNNADMAIRVLCDDGKVLLTRNMIISSKQVLL